MSRTFTGGTSLVRAIPTEDWLDARDRTTLDLSVSHAGAERDQYFTPRVYAFGQAAYDHNFSQGLDLQQSYGGGPLNNAHAYSAVGSAGLTIPVYKRFSLGVDTIDTFLNDPPPGFRKNSFHLTRGLTYTLP